MGEEEYDFIFKVLLLGNSDVGKSSLILRYVDQVWNEVFVPTIGVDFKVKTLTIDNKQIKMQIWDTAGQERFRNVISSYFKGSHGILLVYDITNRDSFKNLENWLIEIEKNASENVLKILIGNKNDLVDEREINADEGQAFANRNGMQFIETSAKMNTNVNEAFEALARLMMDFNSQKSQPNNKPETKKIKASSGKDLSTKKGCC
jgi:Ras-related protein Rab-1A